MRGRAALARARPLAVAAATVIALATLGGACSDADESGRGSSTSVASAGGPTSSTRPAVATTTTVVPRSQADVAVPATAAAVVEALTRVERGLRRDGVADDELARLGWEQHLAYAVLAQRPEWHGEVFGALDPDIAAVARANVDAGTQLSGLAEPQPDLPAWRIRAPKSVAELLAYYEEGQSASNVPWPYLAAIHFVETRMGRIVGTSTAGAQGPMQFIPETWAAFGEGDIYDDRDAILAAARYLASRGAPDDMRRALYSYNNSDRYVSAIASYAEVIARDPRAYVGYYHWQVHYGTTSGRYLLPEGFGDGVAAVRLDALSQPG